MIVFEHRFISIIKRQTYLICHSCLNGMGERRFDFFDLDLDDLDDLDGDVDIGDE